MTGYARSLAGGLIVWLLVLAACAAVPDGSGGVTFEQFVGRYEGPLTLGGGRTITMRLEVAPVLGQRDRFHWRLTYEGQPTRDYTLIVRDRGRGEAVIDEHNGIVLPAALRGSELVSVFQVGDSVLDVRYRLEPGGVAFALESFGLTGGAPAGEGVTGFAEVAVQRAALARR